MACAAGVSLPGDFDSPTKPVTDAGPTETGVPVTSAPDLGAASSFVVLAGSTVTNVGTSTIEGDVGVSPGDQVSGLPAGTVAQAGSVAAFKAQDALGAAFDGLTAAFCNRDLTGTDLAGMTLPPGVYCFTGTGTLTGDLVLDGQSNPDALFIFKFAGAFNVAEGATVKMINGGRDCSVYWRVNGSAQIGVDSEMVGTMLAAADIDMAKGASISGRALTRYGAVKLDTVYASICE